MTLLAADRRPPPPLARGGVLHVCNGLDPRRDGGMVPSILGMTAALAARSGPLTIATPTPSRLAGLALPAGVELRGPDDTDYREAIARADVVHLHGLWQRQTRVGGAAARRASVPYLVAAHGMAEPWAMRQKRWKKRIYAAMVEGRVLRRAACLHALTRPEIGHLRALAPGAAVALVPNGVDLAPFDDLPPRSALESQHPELAGKFLLLFLGRLHPKKGLDLLAGAFGELKRDFPDLHLLLAGSDDGALGPFEAQAKGLGVEDRVTKLGHVSGEAARKAWGAADAFVLPSYSEGFSMAVLEALAARKPALITTACHFPELAEAGAGVVVEPTAEGVTGGLRSLLERSAAERAELAERGRSLVESRYTWDRQAERLEEVYRWAAGGGAVPEAVDCGLRNSDCGLGEEVRTMDKRVPVSVIVPVKNEEENLRRCLPALGWADEVFVVDSGSVDGTEGVAREYGAEVVQFRFNGTYPKKKNWALDNLPMRNEWVLIVDADEVVPPSLAEEIASRVADDEADGFYLNMKYFFLGRRIKHCGYSECWNLRLFKHGLGRYERMPAAEGSDAGDNEAHEHVELEGRVGRLVNELDHHAYPTISAWVEKHNRYASWEAEQYERFLKEPVPGSIGRGKRFKRRLKKLYLRLPGRPLIRFAYSYFLRLGFLDGMPGLVFCGLLSYYDFLCWAKVYERRLAGRRAGGSLVGGAAAGAGRGPHLPAASQAMQA